MLKKCVAVACTAVLGGAMIVGFAGCENKPKAPATAPDATKPADGGAAPATTPPAGGGGDHDQK